MGFSIKQFICKLYNFNFLTLSYNVLHKTHSKYIWSLINVCWQNYLAIEEQDKPSDIEQQPPFGDRKLSNTQPHKRGVTKPTGTSYNFDKV